MTVTDLSGLQRDLRTLDSNMNQVNENVIYVARQLDELEAKVSETGSVLQELRGELTAFKNETLRQAAISDAQQRAIMLRQDVDKRFGYYDEIRRHANGILQANDLELVRGETIIAAAEQMMLSAPRYWLAPALIALAAWINNDRELSDRAVQEALRRDDEKASLFFCLVSRRTGRQASALAWLNRYLLVQDPEQMENRVIAVLDAYAGGVFGQDANGSCSQAISQWLDELSRRPGFNEQQIDMWRDSFLARTQDAPQADYPHLGAAIAQWPDVSAALGWAAGHRQHRDEFSRLLDVQEPASLSLVQRVDSILMDLVANYDDEELEFRRELRRNELIVACGGDIRQAEQRLATEMPAFSQYEDFSRHLAAVVLNHGERGCQPATRRLALILCRDWIEQAYHDITVTRRQQLPRQVDITLEQWQGMMSNGREQQGLEESLKSTVYKRMDNACNEIKFYSSALIGPLLAALAGGAVLGAVTQPVYGIMLGLAVSSLAIWRRTRSCNDQREKIKRQYEQHLENSLDQLRAVVAEYVDLLNRYRKLDAESELLPELLQQAAPEQYVDNGRELRRGTQAPAVDGYPQWSLAPGERMLSRVRR